MYYRKNPKKDSLNLFRYQPNKRFLHTPRNNDPPPAPESKRQKLDSSNEKVTEHMMDNLEKFIEPNEKEPSQYSKSIKWRSPLIYSPPVKFSPKIPSSFSFSVPMPRNIDSENSHDWSLNTVETNNSSKTVRSLSGTTPEACKDQSQTRTPNQGTKFLLSDRDSAEKPLNISRPEINVMQTPQRSQQIQDFFSSSFLEEMGYSEKQKMSSNLRCFSQKAQDMNTSVQSAGSYYHDMVAKTTKAQNNSEALSQISQKPFFLNQNHLSLPESKFENNGNYGCVPNNNQLFGQNYSQRNFVPQIISNMPERNITTQAVNMMDSNSLDNRWLAKDLTGHHMISPGDTSRPEFYFTPRQLISNDSVNFWPQKINLENQIGRFDNSQQMAKYPLEMGHHTNFYDKESNYSQTSFARAMNINNFSEHGNAQFGDNRPIPQLNQPIPDRMATRNLNARNFEDVKLYEVNACPKTFPPGLENRQYFDKENSDYQMNVLGANVNLRNRNQSQIDSPQGFFLNQAVHPQFEQAPNVNPLWNTFCIVHKIYNCHFCQDQKYSVQPNINVMNVPNQLSRKKSFNSQINPGLNIPNEYFNIPAYAPFSQQYADITHRDKSFLDRADMSSYYGMQNYCPPIRGALRYDSGILNSFGGTNLNIPSEIDYQKLPMDNDRNEDQRSMGEQKSNKSFLLSKFLNSFDESQKIQK